MKTLQEFTSFINGKVISEKEVLGNLVYVLRGLKDGFVSFGWFSEVNKIPYANFIKVSPSELENNSESEYIDVLYQNAEHTFISLKK